MELSSDPLKRSWICNSQNRYLFRFKYHAFLVLFILCAIVISMYQWPRFIYYFQTNQNLFLYSQNFNNTKHDISNITQNLIKTNHKRNISIQSLFLASEIRKTDICLLNVDTRPLERFTVLGDLDKMQFHSLAAYNNLFYGIIKLYNFHQYIRFIIDFSSALRHRYYYRRITAVPIRGYAPTWVKVTELYKAIQNFSIVVFLDADAYLVHPNISIEFLMDRYNFSINSSLLMAIDPNRFFNKDSKGRIVLNTGFIIARNTKLTKTILQNLANCSHIYKACDQWNTKWSFEQRAFSEYFRDQMKLGSELIAAPCNELNGYSSSRSGCLGLFLSHVWNDKPSIIQRLKRTLLTNLMELLEAELWNDEHFG